MSVRTCLPVSVAIVTATTGASSQLLAAATNDVRNFLMICNDDTTNAVWLQFGGTAASAATGLYLAGGLNIQFSTFVPTNAVQVIAAAGTPAVTVYYA